MTRLATWAAAHNPVLTIAREGQSFTKPADGSPFVSVHMFPGDTMNVSVDGVRKRFRGEFTVNVWTKDGIGTGTGEAICQELAELFPVVPKSMLPVSVEQPPSIKKSIQDDSGWLVFPVAIMYRMEG